MSETLDAAFQQWLAITNGFAGGRVYPLILPQKVTFPAITYHKISQDTFSGMAMAGPTGYSNNTYQLGIYGEYKDIKELSFSIRQALDGFKGTMAGQTIQAAFLDNEQDLYEDDNKIFRVLVDATLTHKF
jgi:hypothetical protein